MKYRIWLFLGKIFDFQSVKPLGLVVRLFYLNFLTPLLGFIFRHDIPGSKLIPRHSTKTGLRFNPFFSDLDLTIVVPDAINDKTLADLRKRYLNLKTFLPFLGEIEIFTVTEFTKFEEILSTHRELFALIRTTRKLKWLTDDILNTPTEYHRYKIKRALEVYGEISSDKDIPNLVIILEKLGNQIGNMIPSIEIKIPHVQALNDVNCAHLGWSVRNELKFDEGKSWSLLAILPSESKNEVIENYFQAVRSRQPIRNLYLAYTEYEAIQIRAVYRARPETFPWMKEWAERLNEKFLLTSKNLEV